MGLVFDVFVSISENNFIQFLPVNNLISSEKYFLYYNMDGLKIEDVIFSIDLLWEFNVIKYMYVRARCGYLHVPRYFLDPSLLNYFSSIRNNMEAEDWRNSFRNVNVALIQTGNKMSSARF